MQFSGALTLTDLNDFITPSQACIKPVEEVFEDAGPQPGDANTRIELDSSGAYHEVTSEGDALKTKKKLKAAQITLNDCLACSGCITSAESVLITLQSHTEVFNFLKSNPPPSSPEHRIPILSISPQSLASFSASLARSTSSTVSIRRILRRVRAFCCKELGFYRVYDTTFARHIALKEHAKEFAERRHRTNEGTKTPTEGSLPLPMISSACPGWVCYAEKTHSEMLPYISRTKSPQQVMGTLVKTWMGRKWNKTPDGIYHVSVMPCYDKKLEASRKDFYDEAYSTRDVDCVITTGELKLMMEERGWNLSENVPDEDAAFDDDDDVTAVPELVQHPGSSSGSYLQSVIDGIVASVEREGGRTTLDAKTIRNSDSEEFVLTDAESGKVLFKGAKCYGFRNLQNVVRKVGREGGKGLRARRKGGAVEDTKYDYVEVMACPSGCVNGGGQLKDAEGFEREWSRDGVRLGQQALVKKVEEAYWSAGGVSSSIDKRADEVMRQFEGGALRTNYRAVESEVNGLTVQW